jgi:hypothetical protein
MGEVSTTTTYASGAEGGWNPPACSLSRSTAHVRNVAGSRWHFDSNGCQSTWARQHQGCRRTLCPLFPLTHCKHHSGEQTQATLGLAEFGWAKGLRKPRTRAGLKHYRHRSPNTLRPAFCADRPSLPNSLDCKKGKQGGLQRSVSLSIAGNAFQFQVHACNI